MYQARLPYKRILRVANIVNYEQYKQDFWLIQEIKYIDNLLRKKGNQQIETEFLG